MTEGIIIAIIGAAGVVLAAIIALFKKESKNEDTTTINQRQSGKNNIQIGQQNNYTNGDGKNG